MTKKLNKVEIPKHMQPYLSLTKKELVKIILEKTELNIQYQNWVDKLKNDKKKEDKPEDLPSTQ